MAIIEHEQVLQPEPMVLDEASQILVDAAAIVRERWQQNEYGVHGGNRCAVGAMVEAGNFTHAIDGNEVFKNRFWVAENSEAGERLKKSLGTFQDITAWNDMPGRTAEAVADAMERAAYGC